MKIGQIIKTCIINNKLKAKIRDSGFTLLESLISLSILSIIAGMAYASYADFIANKRLENAANQIFTDLKIARSEAIKQKKTFFVSFNGSGEQWCYGINVNTTCDCTKASRCLFKGKNRTISSDTFEGIKLQQAKFAGGGSSTAFDPNRGFAVGNGVKNGTIWLQAANESQVAIIINRLGRVRFCSNDLVGYSKNCPNAPP